VLAGPNENEIFGYCSYEQGCSALGDPAEPLQGTSDVTFNGSDPGAGVWEVTFQVDGKVVQSTVPDENHGHCRDVGQTTDGLAAFDYLQPCPPVESVDVGLNTTAVSNGEHHLVVSVLDPAGNSATVLDREINVQNPISSPTHPPAPAAVPAKPTPKPRARLTLKVSPHTVKRGRRVYFSGRLLGGHISKLGKLLVLVLERRLRSGKWSGIAEIRTGAQGRFHGSYRFNFLGPGDYKLRVLAEAERGYPFATGWSNMVGVRVR
jgi:hypothetical protein